MADVETMRAPRTTVTIDRHVNDEVVERLDETGYLRLGKGECTRAELLLYAMAVGWESHLSIPVAKPTSGGFARTESFTPMMYVLIRTIQFSMSGFEDPDALRDTNAGYTLLESFANGGFQLIEGDLNDRIGSEEKANEIIAELDKRYEALFS